MNTQRRLVIAKRITIGGTIVLGALGYLQELFSWPIAKTYTWLLLISFVFISVAEILLDAHREKHAAEDFYSEELRETFPRGQSEQRMRFYTENGNKCVALTLTNNAIPNSVQLWEGGYAAPSFTFVVKDNVVVFLNSAFTSHSEYTEPGPIYSVKYYPISSKKEFGKSRT